jgi:hypothetical protein
MRAWLRKILFNLLRNDINRIIENDCASTQELLTKEIKRLRAEIGACQALDVGIRERSKIIICAHVGNRDIVKIIEIAHNFDLIRFKTLVRHLESTYGAKLEFEDLPTVGVPSFKEQLYGRWRYPGE